MNNLHTKRKEERHREMGAEMRGSPSKTKYGLSLYGRGKDQK